MASENIAIGIFGRRKVGKSNLVLSLGGAGKAPTETGGLTNVPVQLREVGNVNLLIPAGLDDERALGMNSQEARLLLERIDLALVVIDASLGWSDYERFLLSKIRFAGDPAVAVVNREQDEETGPLMEKLVRSNIPAVELDLSQVTDATPVIALLKSELDRVTGQPNLLQGLAKDGDLVWLVVPDRRPSYLDPIGPMELRLTSDAVELGITLTVVHEGDLQRRWEAVEEPPMLVVADATVFEAVQNSLPDSVPVTTLRMLVSRQRGELEVFVKGARAIEDLEPGGRVLISEACGAHVQPEDIGRVEIPNLLRKYVRGDLEFSSSAGGPMFDDISGYDLVIRCGACMLDPMTSRESILKAIDQNVPVTNYGIALAYLHGVLPRMLQPFVQQGELEPVQNPTRTIPVELHDEYSLPPCM